MSRYIIEKDHVITINRGDFLEKKLKLTTGKFPHEKLLEIGEHDIIFFGLMDPHQHFEHSLIKKEFDKTDFDEEGLFVLTLESEETLDLVPGTYYYSLKLLNEEAEIRTLIQKSKFIIVD